MSVRGTRKHGFKKQPSKAKVYNKVEGTLKEIQNAVINGAIIQQIDFFNKTEYWIKYPQGGYHKISKRIYDSINKK